MATCSLWQGEVTEREERNSVRGKYFDETSRVTAQEIRLFLFHYLSFYQTAFFTGHFTEGELSLKLTGATGVIFLSCKLTLKFIIYIYTANKMAASSHN